jgi:glutathione synthase/RimK-type ligase-like ATP-grasp enzyme
MASTGAPVPETHLITKELRLDAAQWGPFTVIKPNRGLRGQGVGLIRTRDVCWSDTALLPKKDPRHSQELLAQRFIDTGPNLACYRVFMVLGRPIYCMASTTVDERAPLDAAGSEALDVAVAVNRMRRKLELANDREVIDLAISVHARLPHLPVMGLDIIREKSTGRLFVLEYNSTGRVWHLSSDHGIGHQKDHGLDYYAQFDALSTITNALIEATRQRAV